MVIISIGLLVACGSNGSNDDAGPTGVVPTAPTTTNPYAVPEVIDVAYVNRVLAGLDQAMGDVVRLVVAARAIPPEAVERLKAVYVDEPPNPESRVQRTINAFEDGIRRGFPDTKPQPGNTVTTVAELIAATPSCIFAKVDQDYSAASTRPSPPLLSHWVGLVRLNPVNDPRNFNPTSWVFTVNGLMSDRSQPPNPCETGS